MQSLRRARFLARLVLAWFALSIGVAVASPVFHPQGVELVCSAGGAVKLVVKGDDGARPVAGHTLDCPMCASIDAPPVADHDLREAAPASAHVLRSIPAARIAALTAAPLPARGPPARSSP